MAGLQGNVSGRVAEIWRYPVKSMMGEQLSTTVATDSGLLGDRAFALIDTETGRVASAKNPRRWPNLFEFRAEFVTPPLDAKSLPLARITLPGGETLTTDQANVDERLSAAVGRRVKLARSATEAASAEGYWPDHDWLAQRDAVFEFQLPPGTFFDGAAIHLITTATLDCLQALAPASRFEVPRFRPNVVIETASGVEGFVEADWIGRTLALGDVLLRIDGPCPRCIMTTLKQSGLPADPAVLRTAVQQNGGNVGVYATVLRGGRVSRRNVVVVT